MGNNISRFTNLERSMSLTFSISIVSHGHKEHVSRLIEGLTRLNRPDFEVILTLNLPEDLGTDYGALPFSIKVIKNPTPRGFAVNHNAAFAHVNGDYFVILNPDIELKDDPFDALLALLNSNVNSICAPTVLNGAGALEDSARCFPTPTFLLRRVVSRVLKFSLPDEPMPTKNDVLTPDWVAGMFVVVPRVIYEKLNGLDERYHMYFEDVDFCARARLAGCQVLVSRQAKVIHNAQRDSHRKIRYLLWHLQSAFRFFTSTPYMRIRWNQLFEHSVQQR
jgi:N-acetylglucosaminyl-diphospho-decaprenol L-rhamnosyltransferase